MTFLKLMKLMILMDILIGKNKVSIYSLDTAYKSKFFEVLDKYTTNESVSVSDMEVVSEKEQKMIFKICFGPLFSR